MKDWIHTKGGQQALLRVYEKISKKKPHEIMTKKDFKCGLLTSVQVNNIIEQSAVMLLSLSSNRSRSPSLSRSAKWATRD